MMVPEIHCPCVLGSWKNNGPWNSLPLCFGVMKKWWSLKFITPVFWGHEKMMVPEIHYPCVLGSWKNDGPWNSLPLFLGSWKNDGPWNSLPLCFGVMKKWWSLKFITPVFWGHEKMMVPEIHYPCVLGSWKNDGPWNSLTLCFGVMKNWWSLKFITPVFWGHEKKSAILIRCLVFCLLHLTWRILGDEASI